jgi:sugar lactone lactonase YvrE
MKNKQTETKLASDIALPRYLIAGVLCLAVISLICARASAQNLFAVDAAKGNYGNIDEFTPNGVRSVFASGLTHPLALAFDSGGNLFVADGGNENAGSGAVYKFTPAGVRTTFALGLSNPAGLAFDSAGNLFVAEFGEIGGGPGTGRIYKFTPNGVRSTFASGLFEPEGLAFGRAGNLFVAVVGGVYKFTPTGLRTTFASGLTSPFALAFDSGGNLFVGDGGDPYDYPPVAGAVYKFTPTGLRSTIVSDVGGGLAIDSTDNLFVGESHREQRTLVGSILKITPSGARTTFASRSVGAMAFQRNLAPTPPPTPTLVNISTRGSVETGSGVTIGGFIITGTDSKQVVVRGLSPTLAQFNVSGVLADPFLSLVDGSGNVLWNNDNWKDSQQAGIQATGLAPPNDLESAILRTLQPGNYTAVLSGKNGSTGVGLVEVYDTSTGGSAELTNVSTRGFVGTGDNVLIAGFISSGGNGSTQVVVRGLGPTLTQFGVSGALADPVVTLVDGNGMVVKTNDNWKNTQQAAILATALAPPNDLESAMVATVAAGNYTAILSGKNGATGVGLVEVYKVAVAIDQ